jgi:MoxR-like ATPase
MIATQNPVELEGTFPLPEAQLDRFLMRLNMGYPTLDEERTILRRFRQAAPLDELAPVTTLEALLRAMATARQVRIDPTVETYLVEIVRATREHPNIELGVSPRGALALARASQALAAMAGRNYVLPDDIKRLAGPVLAHRLILNEANLRGQSGLREIAEVVKNAYVPVETA